MKLALVTPGFSSDERDWCIPALLDFVQCLAAHAEIHIFALRYPHRVDRYQVYGATVHSLNGVGAGGARSPLLWSRAAREIATEHQRGAFDVLHAFWAYEPGPIAVWAGRSLRVPVVISLAGGELAGLPDIGYGLQLWPHRRALVRWALQRAVAVTAGSRYLMSRAERLTSRLTLAPLGVDTGMFKDEGGRITDEVFRLPPSSVILLNVASLIPVKDQAALLRAFAQVRPDFAGARLAIAGEGESHSALQTLAEELEIGDRVNFFGDVPHEALPEIYRSAAFCVQSSRHEAQGMAVLEAAACGVPTVGTAVGILPELMPDEWLAPPGDIPALAGLIRRGLSQPMTLQEIGKTLRGRMESEFSLEGRVERFLEVYVSST
ncbi:MAG: glycosyltransferase [Chloroflexi bacterium]|nr:glycosyltransferase [Chloroflexota bacterium]